MSSFHPRTTRCLLALEALESRTLLSFFPPVHYESANQVAYLASGDFNNDGFPDLVTYRELLLNNGDGTFCAFLEHGANRPVVPVDVNLDGLLDLATPTDVRLGNGDGTFQEPIPHFPGVTIVAGDFDGDGIPDLLVQDLSWANPLLGNGDGTFRQGERFLADGRFSTPFTGDFNGDGLTDVVTTSFRAREVRVFLSNGDGSFQDARQFYFYAPNYAAVGDLNLDGLSDLVIVSSSDSSLTALLGNGDGTFQEGVSYSYDGGPFGTQIVDGNLDGVPDVVVVAGADVGVYLGSGDGTLLTPEYTVVDRLLSGLTVADFNGDSYPDLATSSSSNTLSVLLNAADWSGGAPGVPGLPPLQIVDLLSFLRTGLRKRLGDCTLELAFSPG